MRELDLNLLSTLDALLHERSVTRAAQRLGLSQPTVSTSLGRLRRHFDDELLHRAGNSYELTPLAAHLAGRTGDALAGVRRVFAAQQTFDPGTSEREFVLVCSDYCAAVVGPAFTAALAGSAPGMRVHLRQGDPGTYTADHDRLRGVDGLVMPHGHLSAVPHLDLYQDSWVCLVGADNASVGAELTVDDLSRLPWVANFHGPPATSGALSRLHQAGVVAHIQVVVDTFLALPAFLPGTDRVALLPARLARLVGADPRLRVLPCPYDAGPLAEALWWHADHARDAEHRWMRQLLAEVAGTLDPGPHPPGP